MMKREAILLFLVCLTTCGSHQFFSFFGGASGFTSAGTNCSSPAHPGTNEDEMSLNQAVASGSHFQIYEYRIPMPMTLEEFDVGRNFMVSRVNQLESDGAGGKAVEIISMKQNNHSLYGAGQHSVKRYNIAKRMPAWLRSLTSVPLVLKEDAWNHYPFTQAILRLPLLAGFRLRIQTLHLEGTGHDNAHQASASFPCKSYSHSCGGASGRMHVLRSVAVYAVAMKAGLQCERM
jgi:hypothetical protein